ncbi:16S rRNA (cytidine(1402)-2'-O)-methyltransferase [Limnothrix sp. FACHB-1083]|uniref:16S rRNA (cytidine(1402)-2'-O)-methyltransferase n=1 Tax=unclassified Limnothrix TaxID=2632864 RepID=UPI00167FFF77|nr:MULTISPECIES: 16S rRNA (cytidine(1402)-2'-O)-methyltransferase [unclassified Limnothrix]MBD2160557.1 16S rRNA (cytidine(1402)-2'-O)-methyltransferase [Limnothrix sp. FACHB-1083]MBD2191259.1 16S rRNA (cytidine(1402)-2'-O)-methyltransferase [Limnothrix sp. FACHB-1088]
MTATPSPAPTTVGEVTTVQPGTLYLVATPIGNLEDISYRALRILQAVDAIAAEDTRHTGKLLAYFQISKPQLSYHEHNQTKRIPEILDRLRAGQAIALVSDAGTPGISDPGVPLVAACGAAGLSVVPVPGACAAIAGLIGSGLPTDRFCFEGFLPTKGKERRDRLAQLAQEARTVILYEAPHRLRETLQDLANHGGDQRPIAIARELTKRYEQFWRGSLSEAIATWIPENPACPIKGEFVLILGGVLPVAHQPTEAEIIAALADRMTQGMSRSAASREIAGQLNLPKRSVYELSLKIPD